ncbi:hypothetical protein HPB51_027978 [Rhipicephalus microplus]|uniref:Cell adhesion molecule n=1 Tax=Rhipicephalus microplus TaxID=6941 RepID=A0A9J6CYL8_RHIMP|nr:hypothetical protein HPB51_027978 [Rhipicephalus microplus]
MYARRNVCVNDRATEAAAILIPAKPTSQKKVVVSCVAVEGDAPLRFSWSRDGGAEGERKRYTVDTLSSHLSSLTIPEVTAQDIGNYTCRVTNAAGTDTFTASLLVRDAPKLQPFYFPKENQLLQTIVVSCISVRGSPPLEFSWSKDGLPLAHKDKRVATRLLTDTISTLTVTNVRAEDIGNYTCRASNAGGFDSFTAELIVTDAPKVQAFYFPRDQLAGKKVVVSCVVVEGDEPMTIRWFKDGLPLASADKRTKITKHTESIVSLTIPEVTAAVVGNYTCAASNRVGEDSFTAPLIVNGKLQPKIGPFNFPREQLVGKKVIVSCVAVEGDEPMTFTWFKDGHPLAADAGRRVAKLADNIASLTVPEVTAADIGNYTCVASNRAGEDSFSASLLVDGRPPRLQPFYFPKQPDLHKKVVVHCTVLEGDEPFEFAWYKDNQLVVADKNVQVRTLSESLTSLTVHEVAAENVGNYTCEASNVAGSDRTSAELLVKDAPLLQKFQFKEGLSVGDQTAVVCAVVGGSPPFTIRWSKDGRPIAADNEARSVKTLGEGVSTLSLRSISASDVGNYTCVAENAVGSAAASAALLIQGSRDFVPLHPVGRRKIYDNGTLVIENVESDDEGLYQCDVSNGVAPPLSKTIKVSVHADWSQVRDPRGERHGMTSVLVIHNSARKDATAYVCVAKNDYGQTKHTFRLTVLEPPESPTDVVVTERRSRYVSVKWSPPRRPVNRYVFRYWRKSSRGSVLQEQEVDGMRTSLMVTNLHPGTEYLALVLAENSVGFGDPSDTITFQTAAEEPSAPPMNVQCEALDTRNIKVSWEPPPADQLNGELKGYYIGHKMDGTPFVHDTVNRDTEQRTFRGLQAASTYRFMLKAFNEVGSGPASEEVACTTLNGDPPAVPSLRVTGITSNSVSLHWNSPTSAASPVIRKYMLVYAATVHYTATVAGLQDFVTLH